MRGLKLIGKMMPILILVASFTDAWIETSLKGTGINAKMSHLLQMRGLKLLMLQKMKKREVASFTDAWIETCVGEKIFKGL